MFVIPLLSLVLAGSGPLGPGEHQRTITVGEWERSYLVHIPPTYDRRQRTPVVLALHGAETNSLLMAAFSGLNQKADEAGFVVVYPDGTGLGPFRRWNAGEIQGQKPEDLPDDVAFLERLLDDLATVVHVDSRRVYATGMSNGSP